MDTDDVISHTASTLSRRRRAGRSHVSLTSGSTPRPPLSRSKIASAQADGEAARAVVTQTAKADSLDSAQAHKMAAALTEAADLVEEVWKLASSHEDTPVAMVFYHAALASTAR